MDYGPGSNPSSALSAPRDRFPFYGDRINPLRCSAEGHRGRFLPPRSRSIPCQAGWTSPEPPGASRYSRSFTEPQLSSGGVWSTDRRGRDTLSPHALTAQRRDPGGRTRSGDGADGQCARSGPLPPPVTEPSGDQRPRICPPHFLVGRQVQRPFISLRMRNWCSCGSEAEQQTDGCSTRCDRRGGGAVSSQQLYSLINNKFDS